jgi:hypothetical protein
MSVGTNVKKECILVTLHCRKWWHDVVSQATTRFPLRFWGLTLFEKLFSNFIIIFLNSISTGRMFFNSPT